MWYRHGSRHYSERPCNVAGAASWRRLHQRWGWHAARRAFNSSHQEGWSPSTSIHLILAPSYGKSIGVNPDYAHQPRKRALERGIMTSSPAWGFARPDSTWGHVRSLNDQPLNNQALNNRPLDNQVLDNQALDMHGMNIQGAGWWPQVEKPCSIFPPGCGFFGGKGWLIPHPSC